MPQYEGQGWGRYQRITSERTQWSRHSTIQCLRIRVDIRFFEGREQWDCGKGFAGRRNLLKKGKGIIEVEGEHNRQVSIEGNNEDRNEIGMMVIYIIYLHLRNSNIYLCLLLTPSNDPHWSFCSTWSSLTFFYEYFFSPAHSFSSFFFFTTGYPSRIR